MYVLTDTLPTARPSMVRGRKTNKSNNIRQLVVPNFHGVSAKGIKSIVLTTEKRLKLVSRIDRTEGPDNLTTYQTAEFHKGDYVVRHRWEYNNDGDYLSSIELIETDGDDGCNMRIMPWSFLEELELPSDLITWLCHTLVTDNAASHYPLESGYETIQGFRVGVEDLHAMQIAMAEIYPFVAQTGMTIEDFVERLLIVRNQTLESGWSLAPSVLLHAKYDFVAQLKNPEKYTVQYITEDKEGVLTLVKQSDEVKPELHLTQRVLRLVTLNAGEEFIKGQDVSIAWRVYKA